VVYIREFFSKIQKGSRRYGNRGHNFVRLNAERMGGTSWKMSHSAKIELIVKQEI
jgi:hypothetical protein